METRYAMTYAIPSSGVADAFLGLFRVLLYKQSKSVKPGERLGQVPSFARSRLTDLRVSAATTPAPLLLRSTLRRVRRGEERFRV